MLTHEELKNRLLSNPEVKSEYDALSVVNECIEDIEDLMVVAERREEPTISHERLLKELSKDGLV